MNQPHCLMKTKMFYRKDLAEEVRTKGIKSRQQNEKQGNRSQFKERNGNLRSKVRIKTGKKSLKS